MTDGIEIAGSKDDGMIEDLNYRTIKADGMISLKFLIIRC
jgi:hypothetical protein